MANYNIIYILYILTHTCVFKKILLILSKFRQLRQKLSQNDAFVNNLSTFWNCITFVMITKSITIKGCWCSL